MPPSHFLSSPWYDSDFVWNILNNLQLTILWLVGSLNKKFVAFLLLPTMLMLASICQAQSDHDQKQVWLPPSWVFGSGYTPYDYHSSLWGWVYDPFSYYNYQGKTYHPFSYSYYHYPGIQYPSYAYPYMYPYYPYTYPYYGYQYRYPY
jgi:hypothetical protein